MTSTLVNESDAFLNYEMEEENNSSFTQSLGQQDFLRLMVAQIQNKTPSESEVNDECLSQIGQFSSNEALSKMQESMQQMANSLQSNQALQASALVGRKVLIHSDSLNRLIEEHVNSVSFGQNGGGLKLNLAGGSAISLDQVRQITI